MTTGDMDVNAGLTRLRELASDLKPLKSPPNGKNYGWAVGMIIENVQWYSDKYGIDLSDTYFHLRRSPLMDRIVEHSDIWQIEPRGESFEIIEKVLCESFGIDIIARTNDTSRRSVK